MKEQFVPYELAVKLKSLNFNKPCLAYYYSEHYKGQKEDKTKLFFHVIQHHEINKPHEHINSNKDFGKWYVQCPLWQQAFDWCLEIIDYNTMPNIFKCLDGKYYCNGLKTDSLYLAKKEGLKELINLVELKKDSV